MIDEGFFSTISLTDIINSAIGAFFGMWASLLLERMLLSFRKKKSIKNIISELVSIRDGIRCEIVNNIPEDLLAKLALRERTAFSPSEKEILLGLSDNIRGMAFIIYVPIWETVIGTGDILEFKSKPYFEDLIFLYTKIYKLRELIDAFYHDNTDSNRDFLVILETCLEIDQIFSDKKAYSISTLVK